MRDLISELPPGLIERARDLLAECEAFAPQLDDLLDRWRAVIEPLLLATIARDPTVEEEVAFQAATGIEKLYDFFAVRIGGDADRLLSDNFWATRALIYEAEQTRRERDLIT